MNTTNKLAEMRFCSPRRARIGAIRKYLRVLVSVLWLVGGLGSPSMTKAEVSLFGVSTEMTQQNFIRSVEARGYACLSFQSYDFCFDATHAKILGSKYPEVSQIDKIVGPLINQGMLAEEDLDVLEDGARRLGLYFQEFKYIVRLVEHDQVSIFFSCSVFDSCNHERSDVVSSLKDQTGLSKTYLSVYRPHHIDYALYLVSKDIKNSVGYKEMKEEGQPCRACQVYDELRHGSSFSQEITPCFYEPEVQGEICLYEGIITYAIPQTYVGQDLFLKNASAKRLVAGFSVNIGIIVLNQKEARGTKLDFK